MITPDAFLFSVIPERDHGAAILVARFVRLDIFQYTLVDPVLIFSRLHKTEALVTLVLTSVVEKPRLINLGRAFIYRGLRPGIRIGLRTDTIADLGHAKQLLHGDETSFYPILSLALWI